MAKKKTQAQAAEELVKRARYGDENAMALIQRVGENARAGNPTAKSAYAYIADYIKNNPTTVQSPMGAEEVSKLGILRAAGHNPPNVVFGVLASLPQSGNTDLIQGAIVALSNACLWNKDRIGMYDEMFSGDQQLQNLWRFGYAFSASVGIPPGTSLSPSDIGVVCGGHCIGTARKLQLARLKHIPLSVLGPQVGWEMGCSNQMVSR